ncbi:hypothetical protein QF001_000512 [Paraburkholderia youngii]
MRGKSVTPFNPYGAKFTFALRTHAFFCEVLQRALLTAECPARHRFDLGDL